jgi:hypothetical protein
VQKRVDVRVARAIVPSSVSDGCEGRRFEDGRATAVSWAANLLVSTPFETRRLCVWSKIIFGDRMPIAEPAGRECGYQRGVARRGRVVLRRS